MIALIVIAGVLYLLFHIGHAHRNYRRHRLTLWASMAGPFGTRISKRVRL